MAKQPYYITTAIAYTSGKPHIGNTYEIDLEVDGGINLSNVTTVLEAGANVIVAGSAVYKDDIRNNTKQFMDILQNGGRK